MPVGAKSTKQPNTATSTPEAEIVAAFQATKSMAIPAQLLWEGVFKRPVVCEVKEDSQTALQVIKTGRNPTMRHLPKHQGVSLSFLHQAFESDTMNMVYQHTDGQKADIFTKVFKEIAKWKHAVSLIGIQRP